MHQQQQINFAEGTVLTRFTTRVIIIWVILSWFFFRLRQRCNEVRWCPGQEASLAHPCPNLRPFGSKCTPLKKVIATLLGLSGVPRSHSAPPAVIRRPYSDSAPGDLRPPCPPSLRPELQRIIYFQNTGFKDWFPNTGLLPASAKLAVKYRPDRWNTGHLTTLCGGRRKVPTMSQVLSSIKYIYFRKTSGWNMGRQTCFLPRAPSNLYALAHMSYS